MSRLLLLLAFAGPGCAAEAVKLFRPTGAQSTHDLRYLPEDRYTGDTGARRDRELLLDIHVPATGKGPFPLLLTVHGGAWAAGAKENKPANEFTQAAIARGYAVAALNYILKPKEIVPQVFWDAQDSLRFLRQQAARFRIDPTRFGAIGWSAGGWLVSNLGFAGGDAVIHAHQGGGLLIADFAQGGKRGAKPWQLAEIGNPTGLAFPAWAPRPSWPDQYGQVQGISFDFSFWHGLAQPAAAAANQWAGADFHNKGEPSVLKAGVVYDYSVLAGAGWKGKQVHVPAMDSPCISATGNGTVPLTERILQFFDRQFGPEGRAPAPEIRPFLRLVEAPTEVTILVPDPAIAVHYTTDGSDPTPAAARYAQPFTVPPGTTVKALAVQTGRQPSGIAQASFLAGPVPPRISAPLTVRLPAAAVGTPYQVQFTAEGGGETRRWGMAGEILPRVLNPRDRSAKPVDVMGLKLDPTTGILAGTPKVGGTFWVQIAVARGAGQLADVRNYLLPVSGTGGALGGDDPGDDTNTEIARLAGWTPAQTDALVAALAKAGCAPVVQPDDAGALLLVPAAHVAKAKPIVTAAAQRHGLKSPLSE